MDDDSQWVRDRNYDLPDMFAAGAFAMQAQRLGFAAVASGYDPEAPARVLVRYRGDVKEEWDAEIDALAGRFGGRVVLTQNPRRLAPPLG